MSSIDEVILTINLIEANLTKKVDLDMISGVAHYPKCRPHRVSSDTVGFTVHNYIQRRQLTRSAKLLVSSYKPIVQIAFLSGYQDQQAFINVFTTMHKMLPNIYRENERFYPLQLKFNFEGSYEMLDRRERTSWRISFVSDEDIPDRMELVGLVIDSLSHLNEEGYIRVLRQKISIRQVLILKDGGTAIGTMLFSYESGSTNFTGSYPFCRKRGVLKAILDKVMRELLKGKEINITTYREGDKADIEYQKEIMGMSFAEAELLVEYGYPTQRFILQQEERDYG